MFLANCGVFSVAHVTVTRPIADVERSRIVREIVDRVDLELVVSQVEILQEQVAVDGRRLPGAQSVAAQVQRHQAAVSEKGVLGQHAEPVVSERENLRKVLCD